MPESKQIGRRKILLFVGNLGDFTSENLSPLSSFYLISAPHAFQAMALISLDYKISWDDFEGIVIPPDILLAIGRSLDMSTERTVFI
jgi:hypothetical protein